MTMEDPRRGLSDPAPGPGVRGARPIIDLTGRVVVVTGGNSGIGLGISRVVARAGGSVAIWGRRADRNDAAAHELQGLGAEAIGLRCHVSEEASVEECMERTQARFGRIDCLVANAGTSFSGPFLDMATDDWRSVTAVNLDGAFLCLRAAARVLVGQGRGAPWWGCRRRRPFMAPRTSSTIRRVRPA